MTYRKCSNRVMLRQLTAFILSALWRNGLNSNLAALKPELPVDAISEVCIVEQSWRLPFTAFYRSEL